MPRMGRHHDTRSHDMPPHHDAHHGSPQRRTRHNAARVHQPTGGPSNNATTSPPSCAARSTGSGECRTSTGSVESGRLACDLLLAAGSGSRRGAHGYAGGATGGATDCMFPATRRGAGPARLACDLLLAGRMALSVSDTTVSARPSSSACLLLLSLSPALPVPVFR